VIEDVENEISMKQYLLGELTEEDRQQFEKQLMTSDEYFERLLIAEDELVDEYLRGRLSPREQEKFSNHFLCTPERHEKLRFSSSLHRYVSTHAGKAQTKWTWPPFFSFIRASYAIKGWAMATALFLLTLGGAWLSVRTHLLQHALEEAGKQPGLPAGAQQESQRQMAQLREHNDQLTRELQQQQKQGDELKQELAALRTSSPLRSSSSLVAFALTPGVLRDIGGAKKVVVPASANWVRVELSLMTGDHKKYQAVLQKDTGEEVLSQITPSIKPGNGTAEVILTVPAELLPHGDYVLKLSGMADKGSFEGVATYQFRVVQK
jgi:hypothetical protein